MEFLAPNYAGIPDMTALHIMWNPPYDNNVSITTFWFGYMILGGMGYVESNLSSVPMHRQSQ